MPWWYSFKNTITNAGTKINELITGTKNNEDIVVNKKENNPNVKKVQNMFYEEHLENNKWHIIDIDNSGVGYNYFFNEQGKILVDTVTKDYKIVDINGREVDLDLEPIIYKVATRPKIIIEESYEIKTTSSVIYSPKAKNMFKSRIYDNTMDRNMLNYIEYSKGFKKTTNGTIYNGSKWRGVSSLKDDGSIVVFYNPSNNFNKITGLITNQEVTNADNSTRCTLYVYDKEHDNIYKDEPLYSTSLFNYNEPIRFSFTFNRSVKSIEFYISTTGDSKKRICYLRNLKYGFDKKAYKEELEEKKEKEEEIRLLKELGIYYEIEEIDLDEYEENDYYLDDYEFIEYEEIDLIDKNYMAKEDKARDKVTGPAFDEELKKKKQIWEDGPAFDTTLNDIK
ncbi:MAG: hypothetical protein Q4F88_05170 [Eubacteriales bacterium]|nr:hypothetical protein [Eubacteriales bacterium]